MRDDRRQQRKPRRRHDALTGDWGEAEPGWIRGSERDRPEFEPERSEAEEVANRFTSGEIMRKRAGGPRSWPARSLEALGRAAALLGPGALSRRRLIKRLGAPIDGPRRIAVISRKGGVGKTTTTLMIGHAFASHRDDRVVAIDGNPDAGSLTYRVARETTKNMIDLLTAPYPITSYADLRPFTNRTSTRLEVLAAVDDPRISESLRETDYRRVAELLDQHYGLICMDTGTGMLESEERGIFNLADQVVLVMGPTLDSARTAAATFDWLQENGHPHLVSTAVAAVNSTRKQSKEIERIERHFRARCRDVVRIPWDPRLDAGAEAALDELRPATKTAFLRLAAALADGFPPLHNGSG